MTMNRGSGYYITDTGLALMENLEKKVTNDFRRRALKQHRLYVVLMSIRDEDPLDDFELIRLDWGPRTLQRILQDAETKGYIARETADPLSYKDWSMPTSGYRSKRPVGTVGYDLQEDDDGDNSGSTYTLTSEGTFQDGKLINTDLKL